MYQFTHSIFVIFFFLLFLLIPFEHSFFMFPWLLPHVLIPNMDKEKNIIVPLSLVKK